MIVTRGLGRGNGSIAGHGLTRRTRTQRVVDDLRIIGYAIHAHIDGRGIVSCSPGSIVETFTVLRGIFMHTDSRAMTGGQTAVLGSNESVLWQAVKSELG